MAISDQQVTERDLDIFADLEAHCLLNTNQLAAFHSHSQEHVQRLRRRLQILKDRRCIRELNTSIDCPNDYVLAQQGMNLLAEKRNHPKRRVSVPRSTRQFRPHDSELSNFTVTFDLNIRALPACHFITDRQIFARTEDRQIRSHHGWPVTFSYQGKREQFWLRPDRTIGACFTDRPDGANERYYSVELDRATESQQPSRRVIAATSFKLRAYEATFEQNLLADLLGIKFLYKLFVVPGPRRRDNMIRTAEEEVSSDRAARSMLFACKPPRPAVGFFQPLSEMEWFNGRGEAVRFVL